MQRPTPFSTNNFNSSWRGQSGGSTPNRSSQYNVGGGTESTWRGRRGGQSFRGRGGGWKQGHDQSGGKYQSKYRNASSGGERDGDPSYQGEYMDGAIFTTEADFDALAETREDNVMRSQDHQSQSSWQQRGRGGQRADRAGLNQSQRWDARDDDAGFLDGPSMTLSSGEAKVTQSKVPRRPHTGANGSGDASNPRSNADKHERVLRALLGEDDGTMKDDDKDSGDSDEVLLRARYAMINFLLGMPLSADPEIYKQQAPSHDDHAIASVRGRVTPQDIARLCGFRSDYIERLCSIICERDQDQWYYLEVEYVCCPYVSLCVSSLLHFSFIDRLLFRLLPSLLFMVFSYPPFPMIAVLCKCRIFHPSLVITSSKINRPLSCYSKAVGLFLPLNV